MKTLILSLNLAGFLFGQAKPTAPPVAAPISSIALINPVTKVTPVIPADHKLAYFQADGAMAHLQPVFVEAQTTLQKAMAAVKADCGEGFNPVPVGADPAHPVGTDLVCAAVPPPPAAAVVPTPAAKK